jgi:membrane-bound ClpP family serine protease
LVGKKGATLTELKSCGNVSIEGEVVRARAARGFIAADRPVVVERLEGATPVVEEMKSEVLS